ncbi:hypothetical protein D1610_06475 [Sphingomonas gilva]|uniref:RHS repeat protein n=1 Tax=Sphingomonas gilva TaxID=2305907 RepID=A0A396RNX7_9SPHN|nr:hypothetical protein [Sphingomonas gilva]RHW18128.1 hypothetical protein D1610_06475 [Sphingomonas gilva]
MRRFPLILPALIAAAPAAATEAVTYSYDARGRLIEVERSGTVNDGVTTSYAFDDADNRVTKTVTGSTNPPETP